VSSEARRVGPSGFERPSELTRNEIVHYLWGVYQRSPTKLDAHGDFTWKDQAAAERAGMSVQDYVVGGMDSDFRELLYYAGAAMDAAGIHWTILSGFRDDYRQTIATGLKARPGTSLHGGSITTGGYGHGCAADLGSADGASNDTVWGWLRVHAAEFGLQQPLPSVDPAHVQPRAAWREQAATLRLEHPAPKHFGSGTPIADNTSENTGAPNVNGQSHVSYEAACAHGRLPVQQSGKAQDSRTAKGLSSARLPDGTGPTGKKTAMALTGTILEPMWFVQLAGGVTESAALASFDRIQRKYDRVLGAYRPIVMRATGAGYRWYRARIALTDRAMATKLCSSLHAVGGDCLVLAK